MKSKKIGARFVPISNNKDKTIIGEEWTGEDTPPSYICSWCNRTLNRLIDSGGQNPSYYCNNCQIVFDPELENIRKESKLVVPDRNIEPAVASIQTDHSKEVEIRHIPELRGGFAELQKKGLRFTSYNTTEKE
jgi:uncharacterized Zn finger protein